MVDREVVRRLVESVSQCSPGWLVVTYFNQETGAVQGLMVQPPGAKVGLPREWPGMGEATCLVSAERLAFSVLVRERYRLAPATSQDVHWKPQNMVEAWGPSTEQYQYPNPETEQVWPWPS